MESSYTCVNVIVNNYHSAEDSESFDKTSGEKLYQAQEPEPMGISIQVAVAVPLILWELQPQRDEDFAFPMDLDEPTCWPRVFSAHLTQLPTKSSPGQSQFKMIWFAQAFS